MRSSLLEHIVVNIADVERYCLPYVNSVQSPEAKAWFQKKVRALILNNNQFLYQLPPHAIPPDAPDYVKVAANKSEPIYQFGRNRVPELSRRLSHISDFFQSLEQVSKTAATNSLEQEDARLAIKMISKLTKMNLEQVEQAAEQWNARAGARAKGATKDGGEIVFKWSDGYYAFRYTDLSTMKQDGNDLQNCLRSGMYWRQVEDGSQLVIGIRKSNDEAIVGMRFIKNSNGSLDVQECKGKNNKVVASIYIPYVADLLNSLPIVKGASDLVAAGIQQNKGKWGTIKDIGDLIVDSPSGKVWRTNDLYYVEVSKRAVSFNIHGGQLDFVTDAETIDVPLFKRALNLLAPYTKSVTHRMSDRLASEGLYMGKTGWGTASEVGTLVGTFGPYQVATMMGDNRGHLSFEHGDEHYLMAITANSLSSFDYRMPGTVETVKTIVDVANHLGLDIDDDIMKSQLYPDGYYKSKNQYVNIATEGEIATEIKGGTVYRSTNPSLWFVYDQSNENYLAVSIRNKKLTVDQNSYRSMSHEVVIAAIQYIVNGIDIKGVESASGLGVFKSPDGRMVSSIDGVIGALKAMGADAYFVSDERDFDIFLDNAFAARREKSRLSIADQKKLFNALKPSVAPYRVEETGTRSIYGKTITLAEITTSNSLRVARRHLPDIQEAVDAALEKLDQITIKAMKSNFGKVAYTCVNPAYNNSVIKTARASREAATADVLADKSGIKQQDVSSRFQALNTMRKLGS